MHVSYSDVMTIFLCKLNLQRASLRKTPPSHLCMLMVLPTTLTGYGTCYICSSCYNTIVKHHILTPFIICPFTYPSASMSPFTFASRCSNPAINCSLFCTQRYDQTLSLPQRLQDSEGVEVCALGFSVQHLHQHSDSSFCEILTVISFASWFSVVKLCETLCHPCVSFLHSNGQKIQAQ